MLNNFFELSVDAFLSSNVDFINGVYEYPMVFYTQDGELQTFTEQAFSQNTDKLISFYNQLGVKKISFEIMSNTILTPALSLVSLLWSFQDLGNNEIYSATTRYVIKNKNAKLTIKSVFVVDETEAFNKLKS